MKPRIFALLLCFPMSIFAWHWQDLWSTRDQQGARYLEQHAYQDAQRTFEQPDWQATAAYRAKDFEAASTTFGQLNTADGYYNQGNAQAQLRQYQEALLAYQKSLAIRPNDADTLHNKKIIEELLKQQHQQSQEQQSQNNNNQNSQKQQSQENNDQNSQTPQPQQDTDQQQSQQNNDKSAQERQSEKKNHETSQEQSSEANHNEAATEPSDHTSEQSSENQPQTSSNAESYQTTEQWLNMIPDDPGGLLRQKFLRDHRRRIHGEEG